MPTNTPGPNDPVTKEERERKTLRNIEKAEMALEFADVKDRAAILAKNERRRRSLGIPEENDENKEDS